MKGSKRMREFMAAAAVCVLVPSAFLGGCGGGATSPKRAAAPPVMDGLCFSPYVDKGPSEPDAVTPDKVASLLDIVSPHTRGIRTFSATGTGSQIPAMAQARGLSVAAGCDISPDPAYNEVEVDGLVKLAREGGVDLAVVGEEALFFNMVSEDTLIGYMKRVKETGVKVTTSETWGELIAHPRVLAECDVAMANMFPYWENQPLSGAVDYLDSCYGKLSRAAGGKEIIVETGWPSAGDPKGAAVPSPANAAEYFTGFTRWAEAKKVRYYYFEAFDEPWKAGREGSVGAHWGIWESDGKLKASFRLGDRTTLLTGRRPA